MDHCIFCKIIAGRAPCYKVYEDGKHFGFLDHRPLNPGNVLLIPKEHVRWVYDVREFGEYWESAKKVGLAIQRAVKSHSINFLTLGYEIDHAHIRIIPRFRNDGHNDGIQLSAAKIIPPDRMRKIADAIISELSHE